MKLLWTALLLGAVGCSSLPTDTSPPAVPAGDVTLIQEACSTVPARGFDVCRFTNGQPVTSTWRIYVPWVSGAQSGEMRIRRGDVLKTYAVTSDAVDIPFKDLMGSTWDSSSAGLIQALGTIKYKDKVIQMLGYAFIVILKPGYDPTPVDSSTMLLHLKCDAEAGDSGRSRIICIQ